MTETVVEQIQQFNQQRLYPTSENIARLLEEMLQLKYQAISQNAFAFLRGTCHLFYQDFPSVSSFNTAPATWICGDLHLENFGSFKGDDRQVYFDLNDFDEAVLAPCTWELARFLTSLIVGAESLKVSRADALTLCDYFLTTYTKALAKGQARMVIRETAQGLVRNLLEDLRQRKRRAFLQERTEKTKHGRKLRIYKRTRSLLPAEKQSIIAWVDTWAATQPNPQFFQVLDVAFRLAGTGSLGTERFVLLVRGDRATKDENFLIDLKIANRSSIQPYLPLAQPQWSHQAERATVIQQRMQFMPPALLSTVQGEGKFYLLRELQPVQDRVSLQDCDGKCRHLEKVIQIMGQLTAWAQLRSSGRQGSAIADELIAFAQDDSWQKPLLEYAQDYAHKVETDFKAFRKVFLQP